MWRSAGCAHTLLDLAVVAGPRDLERAVARAEQEQLVRREQLRELVARHKGRRGAPALRAVLRPRFESDRRRAARLAARGILIIPLTWRQIVEEGTATAVHLGQALLRAKLRRAEVRM